MSRPAFTPTSLIRDSQLVTGVIFIVAEQFGVDCSAVTPETNLNEALDCDSLDRIELIMAFEDEFGTSIPDKDVEAFETVQQWLDYLRALMVERIV